MLVLYKNKPPSMTTVHLFAQIASLIDRDIVKKAAKEFLTDKYSKNLDTWSHLVVMLFCQLAGCNSLRDVNHGMAGICKQLNHLGIRKAPSRNALSHQNRNRCSEVFRRIYIRLSKKLLGQHKFECRFKHNIKASRIKLLDSSTITLCLKFFNWAHYSEEKGAIKLHTLFSLRDFLPVDIHISDGKEADNDGAYHVMPGPRSIVVADRGYDDSQLWNAWDSMGTTFVVRLRKDIHFKRLGEFSLPDDRAQQILVDEAIELTGDETSVQYPRPLRRVVVYNPYDTSRKKQPSETAPQGPAEHVVELVTNNAKWDAETVSELYLARWRIETFFKVIKQNLRIKTFLGTNENAVHTQIWTAMIAILLLQYLRTRSRYNWHMSNLVTFLRIHLMSHINLWLWLDQIEISGIPPPKL